MCLAGEGEGGSLEEVTSKLRPRETTLVFSHTKSGEGLEHEGGSWEAGRRDGDGHRGLVLKGHNSSEASEEPEGFWGMTEHEGTRK